MTKFAVVCLCRNMDSWIGRKAHIEFLECQPLMKMLVYRYADFFA